MAANIVGHSVTGTAPEFVTAYHPLRMRIRLRLILAVLNRGLSGALCGHVAYSTWFA